MRTIKYLFLVALSMTVLTSCFEESELNLNAEGNNIAGFENSSESFTVIADGEEYAFELLMKVVGPTVMDLTEPVSVSFKAGDGSTAIEGTHYSFPEATITLSKENNYLGRAAITMLTEGIETPLDASPVLFLLTETPGGAVVGSGKPLRITFNYACPSDLSGTYDISLLRDGGPITPYNTNGQGMIDVITETGVGEYRTSQVGHWDWVGVLGGVGRAGFTFYDVCNVITVPDQNLIEYYSNLVNQNGVDDGEVKPNGEIVISYKITSSWESLYQATYTPQK